jgi:hypothetical protein
MCVPALELPLRGPDDADVAIAAALASNRVTLLEIRPDEWGTGGFFVLFAHG